MKVQRRWRGAMTRQKLLHMLDHYKWRRKQIHNYFLPKSRYSRYLRVPKFCRKKGRFVEKSFFHQVPINCAFQAFFLLLSKWNCGRLSAELPIYALFLYQRCRVIRSAPGRPFTVRTRCLDNSRTQRLLADIRGSIDEMRLEVR